MWVDHLKHVEILHSALVFILSTYKYSSLVVYGGEGEVATWRRSLSSDVRGNPHTCVVESENIL